MICISRRRGFIAARGSLRMSWPSTKTSPEVAGCKRRTVRPVVVLPQPLSPTRPKVSPRLMVNETSSTAFTSATFTRKRPPARDNTSPDGAHPARRHCQACCHHPPSEMNQRGGRRFQWIGEYRNSCSYARCQTGLASSSADLLIVTRSCLSLQGARRFWGQRCTRERRCIEHAFLY